jgi:acetyl-CoA acetyltransferase
LKSAPNKGRPPSSSARKKGGQIYSKPISVAACVPTNAYYSADFRAPVDSLSAKAMNPGPTEVAAKKAYQQAGIGPQEINCFEVQDTDAFCEIEIYEQLGLCKTGEGGRLLDERVTEIGGKYPVNTSGGLISKGEPIGASHLGQIFEIVTQLRGEAGKRQVPKAGSSWPMFWAPEPLAVTILKV